MPDATTTRPAGWPPVWPSPPGRRESPRGLRIAERVALALLSLAAAAGFLLFPTWPNYDSIYSMLWGREVLHLQMPTFEAYRAPTQHPLSNIVGGLLSLLGTVGDRVWILLCIASMVALLAGLYRLGRDLFSPTVGFLAALLLASRLDFAFLAARGYTDTAFIAFVVWAAVLEAARPRRGTAPLVLLGLAGLLRPEAWLLAGLYWLWIIGPATWRQRIGWALLVGAPALIWMGSDLIVTGEPLYSFTHTSGLAAELERTKTIDEVPVTLVLYLIDLVKLPVLLGGIVGGVVGLLLLPKRMALPLVLLVSGCVTFLLIGAGGFSVIDRYLLVAAVMVMLLAAVALGGWSVLPSGPLKKAWAVTSVLVLVAGGVLTIERLNLRSVESELAFRGEARPALAAAIEDPRTKEAIDRCGSVYVPNHKTVPDVRWLTGLPADRVLPRSDPQVPDQPERGVVLITHQRRAIFNQVLYDDRQDPSLNLPPAGFTRELVTRFYTVYVNC